MVVRGSIGGFIGAFLFLSKAVFATITACPTTAPGTPINGLDQLTKGCAEIDKSFTNFNIVATSGATPSSNDIFIYTSGTPPVGNTLGPVSLFFSTPGPGPIWSVANGASMSETVDYQVSANTGGAYSGGTYPTPATPGLFWAINQIVFTPAITINNFGGGTNNKATITMAFCLNAATTTGCAPSSSGTIVATYSGTSTAVYSCTFSGCVSGTSNTINLAGSVTQIAFAETVAITAFNLAGNTVTVNNIRNQFGEFAAGVPEPSTFVLIGSGLLLVALVKRRFYG